MMDNIDALVESGYSTPICNLKVADKGSIITTVALYNTFLKVKAEVDQFKDGLEYNSGSLVKLMHQHPKVFEVFFHAKPEPLTAGVCNGHV